MRKIDAERCRANLLTNQPRSLSLTLANEGFAVKKRAQRCCAMVNCSVAQALPLCGLMLLVRAPRTAKEWLCDQNFKPHPVP
jgi:hypothetical protein